MTELISVYSVVVYRIQYTSVPIQLSPMKFSRQWLIPVVLIIVSRQPLITLEPNGDTAMVQNVDHKKAKVKLDWISSKYQKKCFCLLRKKYLKS